MEVSKEGHSQWLNLTNYGVVNVITGLIYMFELAKELADISFKEWPWQIRELEEGKFLVRFPPHNKVADIENYPSFNMRKQGVQVEVLEWVGDTVPFAELFEVLVQLRRIHPKWYEWKVIAEIASSFGVLLAVDWPSIFKSFYKTIRIRIACRDPTKIPFERLFEMKKKLFVISMMVEGEQQFLPARPIEGDDPDDIDDEADDLDGDNVGQGDMDTDRGNPGD